jgi:hypothetical protein
MTEPEAIRALLERELAADGSAERAAEAFYGWLLDHPEAGLPAVADALRALGSEERFRGVARLAARLLAEPGPADADLLERVRARRVAVHGSPLELGRRGDAAALRRLPARALRLGLQAATPAEAGPLIEAWAALPLYERERT